MDVHYLSTLEQVQLLPRAAEGIRRFRELGFKIAVVSNQSGIARGYFDEEALHQIEHRLRELLLQEDKDAILDIICVCPHHPDEGCGCRKPRIGMALDAVQRVFQSHVFESYSLIEECFVRSIMVGDQESDIEFGRNIGATTFLIQESGIQEFSKANYVVKDLVEVAEILEAWNEFISFRKEK